MVKLAVHLDEESNRKLRMLYFSSPENVQEKTAMQGRASASKSTENTRNIQTERSRVTANQQSKTGTDRKPDQSRSTVLIPSESWKKRPRGNAQGSARQVIPQVNSFSSGGVFKPGKDFVSIIPLARSLGIEEDRFRWLCRKNKVEVRSDKSGTYVPSADVEVLRRDLIRSAAPIYLRTIARLENQPISQLKTGCVAEGIRAIDDPSKGPVISVSDLPKLRKYLKTIPRKEPSLAQNASVPRESRRFPALKNGDSQWNVEGTPLRRYEEHEANKFRDSGQRSGLRSLQKPGQSEKIPFVRIVSGGLPTLGKRHK